MHNPGICVYKYGFLHLSFTEQPRRKSNLNTETRYPDVGVSVVVY